METSSQEKVKSPQEIEEGITYIQTVTWDPFTVLPKEIYLKIFDMLESSSDKQNFMNAHVKWHNLFESKRTLFLFEDVLKEIAEEEKEKTKFWETSKFQKFQHCRLVCRDWDKATQKYFQLHDSYFMIEKENDVWEPSYNHFKITYGPCNSFNWYSTGYNVEKDLQNFSVTHPPSKNPFFSRRITLQIDNWERYARVYEEEVSYTTSVDALLERYGRHLWHCKIEIGNPRTKPVGYLHILAKWLDLMPELKSLVMYYYTFDSLSVNDQLMIKNMQLIQPKLKNLVFLESDFLPATVFNKLFGNLKGLEKIRLVLPCDSEDPLRNFGMSNRENLKEAVLTIKGVEDINYLESSESFPSLKKLVTKFVTVKEEGTSDMNNACGIWPEWKLIFKILEDKFPALEDLTLMLPEAVSEEDKRAAIDHSLECQLNLPKLKRLWINVPNSFSLDFLHSCKTLLELRVILEYYDWGLEEARDFRIIRKGENESTYFNMDFNNMWESTIWTACPALCKLKVEAWHQGPDLYSSFYCYEKVGQDRKYHNYYY